jgi:hypothetical protein
MPRLHVALSMAEKFVPLPQADGHLGHQPRRLRPVSPKGRRTFVAHDRV